MAWDRKPASWSGGSTSAWRKFRAAWLAENPLCIECGALADVVDHHDGINYQTSRCDPATIRGSMCTPCHNRRTAQQGRAAQGKSNTLGDNQPTAYIEHTPVRTREW